MAICIMRGSITRITIATASMTPERTYSLRQRLIYVNNLSNSFIVRSPYEMKKTVKGLIKSDKKKPRQSYDPAVLNKYAMLAIVLEFFFPRIFHNRITCIHTITGEHRKFILKSIELICCCCHYHERENICLLFVKTVQK